ncbi:MAG: molybdenum cofactor biosynthesis protein B [Ectothiorhodospira sp.]
MSETPEFLPIAIAVLTVSDSRGPAEDRSGDFLVEAIHASGHTLEDRRLVPDDRYRIRAEVSQWIADPRVQAIVTTGGTGVTGRDGTPEAVAPLLDKTLEGFGELFRSLSFGEIGAAALQSRALAGVANGTWVFCLPGSTGACRTAWNGILAPQLDRRTPPCNLAALLPRLKDEAGG